MIKVMKTFWLNNSTIVLAAMFFAVSISWLVAPFLHGQHLGNLYNISGYEAADQNWGFIFRLCDIAATIVLFGLIVRLKVWQKDKLAAVLIIIYGLLSVVDATFTYYCQPGSANVCTPDYNFSTIVHIAESIASGLVIAWLILLDIWRRHNKLSIAYIWLQFVLGIACLAGIITGQAITVLEYIYEISIIVWILYFLENYGIWHKRKAQVGYWVRTTLAVWAGLSGIAEIVAEATHLRIFGHNAYFTLTSYEPTWLSNQGVLVGALLIFLARQIYRGQRRSSYFLLAIFGTEVIRYSVIGPHPVFLGIYAIAFIGLFVFRLEFDRNAEPVNFHKRVYDLSVFLGVVTVAVAVALLAFRFSDRSHQVNTTLARGRGYASSVFRHTDHAIRSSDRLQDSLITLGYAAAGITLWSLFRPSKPTVNTELENDIRIAKNRLRLSSNSSEDYFKLWPPDKNYFFGKSRHGFVAYKVVKGTAFTLANPIAESIPSQEKLLEDFFLFCRQKGWSVCFLPVEKQYKKFYEQHFKLIAIGANAIVDVNQFSQKTKKDKWWRWKINQATKAGLSYHFSNPPHNVKTMTGLKAVSDDWLTRDKRREQGFALGYFNEEYLNNCRVHYLTDRDGKIVAFTNEIPIFSGNQTTVDLLRFKSNYPGAMPHLLASLIEQLATEGNYAKLDIGFVPLAQLDNPAAKALKAIGKVRFSAAGLEQFKNKFRPVWQTNYLAYQGDVIDLAAVATKLESALKLTKK